MDKIKNMKQALKLMTERFPGSYVSVQTSMRRYPDGKVQTERRIYSDCITDSSGLGVGGQGATWDAAFEALTYEIERGKHD